MADLADYLSAAFEREMGKPPSPPIPTDITSPEWAEFNRETWRYMHQRDLREETER